MRKYAVVERNASYVDAISVFKARDEQDAAVLAAWDEIKALRGEKDVKLIRQCAGFIRDECDIIEIIEVSMNPPPDNVRRMIQRAMDVEDDDGLPEEF